MDTISTKEILKNMSSQITADQIVAGYNEFLKIVNNPIRVYTHSRENLRFLTEKVFEMAGADALLFGGAWLEAFHAFGNELPTPTESPEQELARKTQAEADRIANLQARDREGGSISSSSQYLSDADREALAEKRQAAFEATKKELQDRVNQIRNAPSVPEVVPTTADALLALKETNLDRSAVVKWLHATPSSLYLDVRKLHYDKTRTWGVIVDNVIAGRNNV